MKHGIASIIINLSVICVGVFFTWMADSYIGFVAYLFGFASGGVVIGVLAANDKTRRYGR